MVYLHPYSNDGNGINITNTTIRVLSTSLLLTDIYMPNMNGFQLCEKILELDVNIRVCFMSAFVVNIQALREVYRNVGFGCFIEKPVSIKCLIERLAAELD